MGQPSDKTGTPSGIACAAEDPKLREKPAPTGNGIDTPPKVTKLGRARPAAPSVAAPLGLMPGYRRGRSHSFTAKT
jgi:hypothetical protein